MLTADSPKGSMCLNICCLFLHEYNHVTGQRLFCAVTSLLLPFTLFLNKWSDFYLTHLFKCLLLQVISLKISKLIPIDGISRGFVSPLHPLTQPASLAKVSLEKVAEGGWPLAVVSNTRLPGTSWLAVSTFPSSLQYAKIMIIHKIAQLSC